MEKVRLEIVLRCVWGQAPTQPGCSESLALQNVGALDPFWVSCEQSGDTLGSDLAMQPSAGLKVTPVEGPTCGVELWGSWNFQRVLEAWVEEGSAFKAVLWGVGIPTWHMCSRSLGA